MAEPLRPGDVVAGKYRIERPIGSGGMGVVVAATHLQLNQLVALKFLVDSDLEPHVAGERFLREARATFRLRSEHTVRVLDIGTTDSAQPFIVMELLEGRDFKQLLVDKGPLAPADAALYMMQACNALQEAHAVGIVHRDLKARNLFLTTRVDGTPCVKVLDFGISKMAEEREEAPLTQPDMGMGSPRYMAPEQWVSASTVDARADIYAAGAVLYELLTGQIPLAGLPLVEVIKRVRAGAVPSPKELRPELPDALCRVVMKALRPRPEERFPTALHFAQALREALPDVENRGRPKPMMAMTIPTAVMSKDLLMARANMERMHAAAQNEARGDDLSLSSTLDEGGPAAVHSSPPTKPGTPGAIDNKPFAQRPAGSDDDYPDDLATIVTQSPMDAHSDPIHHLQTLQVAEAPPEIQALRARGIHPVDATQRSPAAVGIRTTPRPVEPTLDDAMARRPAFVASPAPLTAPTPLAPERKGLPAWLFWLLLIVSFCFAGSAAAALLTRFLQ